MVINGKIKEIFETQQVSETFKKRELIVTTDEQYPQHISIQFSQDKCDILSNYAKGQAVKVSINLRGKEWVNPQGEIKYFNSIVGWRIEKVNGNQPQSHPEPLTSTPFPMTGDFNEEEHNDLPF